MTIRSAQFGSGMKHGDVSEFRGPEPDKEGDSAPTPPVADDDGQPGATPPAASDPPAPAAPAEEPPQPKKFSPFEDKRAKIVERFAARRAEEAAAPSAELHEPEPPAPDNGESARPAETTDEAPAKPGPSDSSNPPAPKPETMTLTVRGKTVTKTLAEVAALAEMSPDEVKADPRRATRWAQKELASNEYFEEAKNSARRDTPSRPGPERTGAPPASPAPDQERRATGNDDQDRPPAGRDTSVDDVAKLVEDIQIGDPKEVAPRLAKLFETVAENASAKAVKQTETGRQFDAERNNGVSALKGFLDDHPELDGNGTAAVAIAHALTNEYRNDLTKALEAEGDTEALEYLPRATPDEIRNAHMQRRLKRDPHVRLIDKSLIETAYSKVQSDLGITTAPKPQQDVTGQRHERKAALPQQPRRASVPPATPPAQEAPLSRKAIVAEMRGRTGKKPRTISTTR